MTAVERFFADWLSLSEAYWHFEDAIVCVLLGLWREAHEHFWAAGMTGVRPAGAA